MPSTAGPRLEPTLPSHVFQLLVRHVAPLDLLFELHMAVYHPSWAHLEVFPPLPPPETLDVDVQHDRLLYRYQPAPPDECYARGLLFRLRAALFSESRPGMYPDYVLRIPADLSGGILTSSADEYSI